MRKIDREPGFLEKNRIKDVCSEKNTFIAFFFFFLQRAAMCSSALEKSGFEE